MRVTEKAERERMNEEPAKSAEKVAIACTLTTQDEVLRRKEVVELLRQVSDWAELDDGFAFRVQWSEAAAENILKFIAFERRCCRFLAFELKFEANEGSIWLHMRGPDGTKEFIRDGLQRAGLRLGV